MGPSYKLPGLEHCAPTSLSQTHLLTESEKRNRKSCEKFVNGNVQQKEGICPCLRIAPAHTKMRVKNEKAHRVRVCHAYLRRLQMVATK